jgi:hypothetical protein
MAIPHRRREPRLIPWFFGDCWTAGWLLNLSRSSILHAPTVGRNRCRYGNPAGVRVAAARGSGTVVRYPRTWDAANGTG